MTDPAVQPHVSVLLDAVLEALEPAPGKLIIDATFGAGGYSRALLDSGCRVIAFDRDPTARAYAEPLLATGRFALIEAVFSTMAAHVAEPCDGICFDLGISSMQVDEADRGFSFMRDGPLDMRRAAPGLAPPTWSTAPSRRNWPASSSSTARSVSRAGSPPSWSAAGPNSPSCAPWTWPRSSSAPWAAGAGPRPIRPPRSSRPCASP